MEVKKSGRGIGDLRQKEESSKVGGRGQKIGSSKVP